MEYTEKNNATVVICVIKFACIKDYKGNISISNAFNATQIFLNPETEEVQKFTAMYIIFTPKIFLNYEIFKILMMRISITLDTTAKSAMIFYLVLRVSDESAGETKILLFNKTAEKLTGRYAWELVNEAAQEDASFMPQALTDLIGRKLLFKISIGPDNKQGSNSAYVVDLVVDDAAMIEEFEAQPIPQSPMVMYSDHDMEAYETFSTTPSSKRKGESSSPLSIADQNSSTKS
ncbi:hypothetical protein Bca101_087742 [Brassica carinata]